MLIKITNLLILFSGKYINRANMTSRSARSIESEYITNVLHKAKKAPSIFSSSSTCEGWFSGTHSFIQNQPFLKKKKKSFQLFSLFSSSFKAQDHKNKRTDTSFEAHPLLSLSSISPFHLFFLKSSCCKVSPTFLSPVACLAASFLCLICAPFGMYKSPILVAQISLIRSRTADTTPTNHARS